MTVAVSTWALHRTLGMSYPDSPVRGPGEPHRHADGRVALTDLPAALKEHGFHRMELCHFHLDQSKIRDLRSALDETGVTLQSLLIDEGDISDPETGGRDAAWIAHWIKVAGQLGAERARVIAGKQPWSPEAFERAFHWLRALAEVADAHGVRLTTENWYPLLSTPEAVNEMLDRLDGKLALCLDFGNWPAPSKYEQFPLIFPRAETCHAKCEFLDADHVDMDDYGRCLSQASDVGFTGPFTLVNGGPGDEWHALELSRDAILSFKAS